MSGSLQEWIWRAAIGFVIALIWYLIKDRRKQKLEEQLAEDTHQPTVRRATVESLDAQIVAMARAWEEERTSKDRRIAGLKIELEETKGELDHAKETIESLRQQAETMQKDLAQFKTQLDELTKMVQPKETT